MKFARKLSDDADEAATHLTFILVKPSLLERGHVPSHTELLHFRPCLCSLISLSSMQLVRCDSRLASCAVGSLPTILI